MKFFSSYKSQRNWPAAFCFGLLLLSALFFLSPAANGQVPPEGRWIGACSAPNIYRHFIVYIDKDDKGELSGFYIEPLKPENMMAKVSSIVSAGEQISFRMTDGNRELTFQGTLSGNELDGSAQSSDETTKCHFLHVLKTPADTLRKAIGTYKISDKRIIVVNPEVRWLYFYDTLTNETRRLSPLSETKFVFGPARGIHYPVEGELTLEKNETGEFVGLTIKRNSEVLHAVRSKYYEDRDISFSNQGIKLAGTLRVPLGNGPFPAVVLLQGSSPQPRWGQDGFEGFLADNLARHGIAVLLFDKRGAGESTGDATDNYATRAADTVASIEFLRSQSKINGAQIGLWGVSQGGQIEPLVAEQTNVSFLVNTSGAAVNSNDQEIQRTELQLRFDGFSEQEIKDAVAFQKLKFHYACHRDNWSEYEAAYNKFKSARWFPDPYVGPPSSKESKSFDFWKCGEDPGKAWENYHGPALLVFGEFEGYSSVSEDMRVFHDAMKKAGNTQYEIRVVKGVEHSMGVTNNGGEKALALVKQYSPEYFDFLAAWMLAHFQPAGNKIEGGAPR